MDVIKVAESFSQIIMNCSTQFVKVCVLVSEIVSFLCRGIGERHLGKSKFITTKYFVPFNSFSICYCKHNMRQQLSNLLYFLISITFTALLKIICQTQSLDHILQRFKVDS